jgi:hypothetical protein
MINVDFQLQAIVMITRSTDTNSVKNSRVAILISDFCVWLQEVSIILIIFVQIVNNRNIVVHVN